jgi:Holliday junction resolvase RusA-like endonuclease
MILIAIPGEPCAQGRGRAVGFRRHDGTLGARVFDPAKSRNWKATAQGHMEAAVRAIYETLGAPYTGPVQLHVIAVFTLARSRWRKRSVPLAWRTGKPDGDNVLKAVKDAAKGILWLDDSQVVDARIQKVTGAQGQAPGVYVGAREWVADPDPALESDLAERVWSMIDEPATQVVAAETPFVAANDGSRLEGKA